MNGRTPIRMVMVVALCALACITMVTYALASGAAQSLFISTYGSRHLPWAWLAVAIGSAGATLLLGRASKTMALMHLFGASCIISAASLTLLLAAHAFGLPHTSFLLYVWKDVYIIVLVELFWTIANVSFGLKQAPRTYGFFCAAGSLGSVVGGLALGPLGALVGTANIMWLILPLLFLLAVGTLRLSHGLTGPAPSTHEPIRSVPKAAVRPWKNSYLLGLGALVAIAQGMITLTEFRFSTMLEMHYALESDRTHLIGTVSAITNSLSFVVQLLSAKIFAVCGLSRTLLCLPIMMGAIFMSTLTQPGPITTSACQIAGKTVDYSLFRAAKEMLYIPLSYEEKTQGKAFVDIFIYRIARGGASMVLLILGGTQSHDRMLGLISVALAGAWLVAMFGALGHYRRALGRANAQS